MSGHFINHIQALFLDQLPSFSVSLVGYTVVYLILQVEVEEALY